MININWFKIFVIALMIACLGILSWQIVAMVETANTVKDYLKSGQTCPNFVDKNDLTMKDSCTGLVWMSRPLPIYKTAGLTDTQPGYIWQNAINTCEGLKTVDNKPLFRLPTVEELISLVKVRCDNTSCTVNPDFFPPDIDKTFANGYFWSANDFNEASSWATDNAGRDYKRSVNLLTGQVDSPVFGKDVHLNAWCVLARQPEIIERKFTSVTNQVIDNGSQATGGSLKTVYNRKCTAPATDDCSSKLGASCDAVSGYCIKSEAITFTTPIAVSCVTNILPGYHVAGSVCQINPQTNNCGNSAIDSTPTQELCDDGSSYNGILGYCNGSCSGCFGTGFRIVSAKCVSNCGDNTINKNTANVTELCDNGADNGQPGKCNTTCDGCGTGYHINTTTHQCVSNCGNGTLDNNAAGVLELCDDGTASNGQADKCNNTCNGCATGYHLLGIVCTSDAAPPPAVGTACANNFVCAQGEKCEGGYCSACPGFSSTGTGVKKFTVTNTTNQVLTDYQVKFNYTLPANPNDNPVLLNITDNNCYIPYYIDENTVPASVWVKVPKIPAKVGSVNGTADIYVSPEVSTSWFQDGPYTFDLFEDFQDAATLGTKWTVLGAGTNPNDWNINLTSFNGLPTSANCNAFVGNILGSIDSVGIIQGSTFKDGICGTGGTPVTTIDKKYTYLGFASQKTFENDFRVFSRFYIPAPTNMSWLNNYKALFGLDGGVLSLKTLTSGTFTTHFAYWDDIKICQSGTDVGDPCTDDVDCSSSTCSKAWRDRVTNLPITNLTGLSATAFPQNTFLHQKQIVEIYASNKLQFYIENDSGVLVKYVDIAITGDYDKSLDFAYAPDQDGVNSFLATFNQIMVTKYVFPEPTLSSPIYP
ncbi:MAG: DUF2341 domain-containing protein [Candidatus Parcubacteria bacterium]|nr:DUF2341 domain-containing protein [Candidatus Parcubacteria bacterium]